MPRPNHTFSQVLFELRKLIASSIQPGEPVPSARELARTYGVAPDTINRAMNMLAQEKLVLIRPRIGCLRSSAAEMKPRESVGKLFRLGFIARRNETELQSSDMYSLVQKEAAARKLPVVWVPNARRGRTTPKRSRVELMRVPWNSFDVGMLFEIEDAQTLSDPLLRRRRVLAVDQDATAYGLNSIAYDDWHAGQLAARHLFDLGHRRFAVSDESNDPEWPSDAAFTQRRLGFESELSRLGGIIRPSWRVEMPRFQRGFSAPAAYRRQLTEWTAAGPDRKPTALFAVSPFWLKPFIAAMQTHGSRIPRDLSVVTVSADRENARVGDLQLTHISMNLAMLVSRAFDIAAELAASHPGGVPPRLISVPALLAPGESTAGVH